MNDVPPTMPTLPPKPFRGLGRYLVMPASIVADNCQDQIIFTVHCQKFVFSAYTDRQAGVTFRRICRQFSAIMEKCGCWRNGYG